MIPKKSHVVQLAIRNSFVFIYLVRIEHGAVTKIPYNQIYRKYTNTENLPKYRPFTILIISDKDAWFSGYVFKSSESCNRQTEAKKCRSRGKPQEGRIPLHG